MKIPIRRTRNLLVADPRRVLAKPYLPGDEILLPGTSRARSLMLRILELPEADVDAMFAEVLREFGSRHREFPALLERHFQMICHYIDAQQPLTPARRMLIGAYFTHEFAVEAAALFNPSIVLGPDQSNLPAGAIRVVLSLRAVGEGHLSSIEFCTGVVDVAGGGVRLEPRSPFLVAGRREAPKHYDKRMFGIKLGELDAHNEISAHVLASLPDRFNLAELEVSLNELELHTPHAISFETLKIIRVLAASNYVTTFPEDSRLDERVIFPAGPNETRGMEDARFVRFTESDGETRYYATYTAYDGYEILPQLIETSDFVRFAISTLNGVAAQNKGMALFPRLVGGHYMMLSRRDRENLHLAVSSDVHFWNDVTELYRPQSAWELLQIGNCGSPIETEAGWLVLTHGVGPMRRYAIGALLLELRLRFVLVPLLFGLV